jgi:hypothetical protein
MARWKAALRMLWRREPAFPLLVYLAITAATVGYARLLGGGYGHVHGGLRAWEHGMVAAESGLAGLMGYAWYSWRMWAGGYMSWTLSALSRLALIIVAIAACFSGPSVFLIGLAVLNTAGTLPLFSPAVLDRVGRTDDVGRGWRTQRPSRPAVAYRATGPQ